MTNGIVYIAPKLLKTFENGNDIKPIDVYAFAFILMFIFTGEKLWNNIQIISMLDKIKNEEKPEFPSNFHEMIRLLIKQCWDSDPKLRPSFELILYILGSSIFMNNIEPKFDLNRFNEYKNKVAFKGSFFENDKYEMVLINGVLFPKIMKEPNIDPFIYSVDVFNRKDSFFKSYEVKSKSGSCEYYSVICIKEEYSSNNTNILSCFSSQIKIMLECEHPTLCKVYGNRNNKYLKNSSDIKNTIFDYFCGKDSLPVLAIDSFYGNKCIIDKIHTLSNIDIFNILYGIAAGMYYLHKREFVLLNLKPANIAINNDNKPIIFIDISARSTSDLNDKLNDIFKVFSSPYTAPELLDSNNNNNYDLKKCDVYSFAMIVYYLLAKKYHFDIDFDKLNNKENPVVDENIPPPFDKLIKECLKKDPLKRLSFSKILKTMGSQVFINKIDNFDIKLFQKYQKTVADKKFIYILVNNNLSRKKDEFKILKLIGAGNFGAVRLVCDKKDESMHAYKEYPQLQSIFFKRMLKILTTINHPSIIKIEGIIEPVEEYDNYVVILPYANNGDLNRIIHQQQKNPLLDYTQKCIILYGIAMGIYYLHNHDIIHRDLNANSILINEFLEPWISGFSFAKFINPDNPLLQSVSCSTPIYMAPEIFANELEEDKEQGYDGKMSDVYAFGIMAYYLMTEIIPFNKDRNQFSLLMKIMKGERPEFPQNIEKQFVDLISKCWKQIPEERATISQICETLNNPDFYISSTNHFDKFKFEEYKKKFGKTEFADCKIIENE